MRPDLCFGGKLKDNQDQPKHSKAPFVVYLLVFQMLVVTVLLPVRLRLTQPRFAQSVRIAALLTCASSQISSQRHLSGDGGLK